MDFVISEALAVIATVVCLFIAAASTTIGVGVFFTCLLIGHVIAWGGFIFIEGDFDWDFFN